MRKPRSKTGGIGTRMVQEKVLNLLNPSFAGFCRAL
jgi:hypothetical protein